MDSSKFLPVELKDKDLYKLVTNLIDYTYDLCTDSRDTTDKLISPLIVDLVKNYKDVEAVNAYYNLFINPIIGTKKSIDSIFSIINDPGKVVEWFDTSIWQYHYIIQYDDFDDSIDIERIIKLCQAFENERSHLISIRSPICGMPFRWDYSKWDVSFYDNMEGTLINGVYVCFGKLLKYYKYVPTWDIRHIYTNVYTGLVPILYDYHKYDEFIYDNDYHHEFIKQHIDYNYVHKAYFGIDPLYINVDRQGNSDGDPLSDRGYRLFDFANADIIIDNVPFHYTPNCWSSTYPAAVHEFFLEFKEGLDYFYGKDVYRDVYTDHYLISDSGLTIEKIYSRTGTTLITGEAPLGYIKTDLIESETNRVLSSLKQEYKYAVGDGSSFIPMNPNKYESLGNVFSIEESNTISTTIYQNIGYES